MTANEPVTDGYVQYLNCPACGEPCTEIPSCQNAHLDCQAEVGDDLTHSWCEDRRGVCGCGARLYVDVDDGRAWLVDEEEHGTENASSCSGPNGDAESNLKELNDKLAALTAQGTR